MPSYNIGSIFFLDTPVACLPVIDWQTTQLIPNTPFLVSNTILWTMTYPNKLIQNQTQINSDENEYLLCKYLKDMQ